MKNLNFKYFAKNIGTVIGLVLIWRGIWYFFDWFDMAFLNNTHLLTAIGGLIVGVLILYLSDKDLKEIEKL